MKEYKKQYLIQLGETVKRLRKEHNMTQTELAEKCGYLTDSNKTMISSIERGKTDIPVSKVGLIAAAFGMTGGELMTMINSQSQKAETCDLFQRCYESQVYTIVEKFLKLDERDQGVIEGRIDSMLESEKYLKRDLVDREIS